MSVASVEQIHQPVVVAVDRPLCDRSHDRCQEARAGGIAGDVGRHEAPVCVDRSHSPRHLNRKRALDRLDADQSIRLEVGDLERRDHRPTEEGSRLSIRRPHRKRWGSDPLAGSHPSLPSRVVGCIREELEYRLCRGVHGPFGGQAHAHRSSGPGSPPVAQIFKRSRYLCQPCSCIVAQRSSGRPE